MDVIQIVTKIPDEARNIPGFDEGRLREAIARTLAIRTGEGEGGLTVVLTDDDELHHLNRTYLGIDRPTDVLAFPSGEIDPDLEVRYLGDVVLSWPRAVSQAEAGGHQPFDEIRLLVIHGILHLLGYDHADQASKAAMWAVQREILADLGIAVIIRE